MIFSILPGSLLATLHPPNLIFTVYEVFYFLILKSHVNLVSEKAPISIFDCSNSFIIVLYLWKSFIPLKLKSKKLKFTFLLSRFRILSDWDSTYPKIFLLFDVVIYSLLFFLIWTANFSFFPCELLFVIFLCKRFSCC